MRSELPKIPVSISCDHNTSSCVAVFPLYLARIISFLILKESRPPRSHRPQQQTVTRNLPGGLGKGLWRVAGSSEAVRSTRTSCGRAPYAHSRPQVTGRPYVYKKLK
ncbi:Hypp5255 [Branchiostoma lanceolatum]|uniref:Hypp5255 protein n=1 Tax=Branchiostoma lanceolatum TaxID=7740 RepID=A0A8K0ADQ1_BRALA|nr:Hypp5255 [Branchiostoma lanceolatum]